MEAAMKKLSLWIHRVEAGNYNAFIKLTEVQKEYNITSMPDEISSAFIGTPDRIAYKSERIFSSN